MCSDVSENQAWQLIWTKNEVIFLSLGVKKGA